MNILLKLVLLFVVCITPCKAAKKYSLHGLNISFAALMYLDRRQTEVIVRGDNNYYEYNWYLKNNHSIRELNSYFGGITVVAITASYLLPEQQGKLLMFALNCIQLSTVSNNYLVDVRVFSKSF